MWLPDSTLASASAPPPRQIRFGDGTLTCDPTAWDCRQVLAPLRRAREFTRSNARRATVRRGETRRKASISSLAVGGRLLRPDQCGPLAAIGPIARRFSITSVAPCLFLHRKASL